MNILDLIKENTKVPKKPTTILDEKAQIVIAIAQQANLVLRYGRVQDARSEYGDFHRAWTKYKTWTGEGKQPSSLHDVAGHFVVTVDLGEVVSISLVDFDLYTRVTPFQL